MARVWTLAGLRTRNSSREDAAIAEPLATLEHANVIVMATLIYRPACGRVRRL